MRLREPKAWSTGSHDHSAPLEEQTGAASSEPAEEARRRKKRCQEYLPRHSERSGICLQEIPKILASSFNSSSSEKRDCLNEGASRTTTADGAGATPFAMPSEIENAMLDLTTVAHVRVIEVLPPATTGDDGDLQACLLPATAELLRSPLIRKLASRGTSRGGEESLTIRADSAHLANALVVASAPIRRPSDFASAWAALDYLLVTPATKTVVGMLRPLVLPLLRPAIAVPSGSLLCERHDVRNMLDKAALSLPASHALRIRLSNGGYAGAVTERVERPVAVDVTRGLAVPAPAATHVHVSLHRVQALADGEAWPTLRERLKPRNEELHELLHCLQLAASCLQSNVNDEDHRVPAPHDSVDPRGWIAGVVSGSPPPQVYQDSDAAELRNLLMDAVMSLPDFDEGALLVLTHARRLALSVAPTALNWIYWRCLRLLYALECTADRVADLPSIPLGVVYCMQAAFVDNTIDLASFLPYDRGVAASLSLLPWPSAKPSTSYVAKTEEEARERATARVGWIRTVWERHPTAWVTGGYLMETLAPVPGHCPQAADVDIFISSIQQLPALCATVEDAMAAYARAHALPVPVVTRMGEYRFTISIAPEREESSVPLSERAALHCDVYTNTLAKVARYHLPAVRCALNAEECFVTPSCAVALATRVCIDYHYFSSAAKTPYEIIGKKWESGYNFVVNDREQRQLLCYLRESCPGKVGAEGSAEGLAECATRVGLYSMRDMNKRYFVRRQC